MRRCITKADFFYNNALGRMLLKFIHKIGGFRIVAWFLHTKFSKVFIRRYIVNNKIDMRPFKGQTYESFAEFFSRKKEHYSFVKDQDVLISPCDGRLTVYPISKNMVLPMKGSHYRLQDLIPKKEVAELFDEGLCLIFRLEASDYHHFCSFDDLKLVERHYIPGLLHSVQPVACEHVPVYRLNRRWWSLFETENFGMAAQIEVGAMVVGGVTFAYKQDSYKRGEEMGNFELAGSTIVLLLDASARKQFSLFEAVKKTVGGKCEVSVTMGEGLGSIKNEE